MKTIRDLIGADSAPADIRERLARCLDDDGPVVTWLQEAGSRSQLIADLREDARDAFILRLDCRSVEPTHVGLARELSTLCDPDESDLAQLASRVSALSGRVVLVFDYYEVFRLADTWLRNDFIPELATSARVIFASREPPSAGWTAATAWQAHFSHLVAGEEPASAEALLAEVSDTALLEALTAASVVRRITRPMLAGLGFAEPDIYGNIAALGFVEQRNDGLALDELVQQHLAQNMQAAEPTRYRDLQRAAWRVLREQLRDSTQADLWRTTADIIFLIENPVIREAFFPGSYTRYSVEPAATTDEDTILDIVRQHEPPGVADAMRLWWRHLPQAFHLVRDAENSVVGFYCAAEPAQLDPSWMQFDPVARVWLEHLQRAPGKPDALFLRRWLSTELGERPGAVQAAAWVDVKRTYLELRPQLRRVYLTLADLGPYAAVATELGFEVLGDDTIAIDDTPYFSAVLDFGPGSVDGWIVNLLAAELGISDDQLLDATARELILGEERIPLTPLEFGVVSMLQAHSGQPVARQDLLREVWGSDYDGGSNVVDAVVRGLRKKCGEKAEILATVRGVGYRLNV